MTIKYLTNEQQKALDMLGEKEANLLNNKKSGEQFFAGEFQVNSLKTAINTILEPVLKETMLDYYELWKQYDLTLNCPDSSKIIFFFDLDKNNAEKPSWKFKKGIIIE